MVLFVSLVSLENSPTHLGNMRRKGCVVVHWFSTHMLSIRETHIQSRQTQEKNSFLSLT